jgi:hypothetical protein
MGNFLRNLRTHTHTHTHTRVCVCVCVCVCHKFAGKYADEHSFTRSRPHADNPEGGVGVIKFRASGNIADDDAPTITFTSFASQVNAHS